jgi:thioredoxin-like negative regulator of GroEL
MESVVAWVQVRERRRLRVLKLDASENAALADRLGVARVPTVVLVKGRRVVARIEGKASSAELEALVAGHLA